MNRTRLGRGWRVLIVPWLLVPLGCTTLTTTQSVSTPPQRLSLAEPQHLPEPGCTVFQHRVGDPAKNAGPRFIAVNGVPTTSRIYQDMALALTARLDAIVIMVDLPGTGGSRLDNGNYSWTSQRACLRAYLARQPDFTLVVHDIAGPILLPLVGEIPNLRRVVVINSLLKPSEFSLPFPMNCLRGCFFLSKPMSYATPFWFYESRFRGIGVAHNDHVSRATIREIYDELRNDGGMGRLVDVMKGFELDAATDAAIAAGLARDIPQLFIWGRRDPALGPELAKLPLDGVQRDLHVIEQGKHFPMLDFTDETVEAIVQWHQRTSTNRGH